MPFPDLLQAANLIERHFLYPFRIQKICHRRVIESDMAVLSNTNKGQVKWTRCQQVGISLQFCVEIGRVSLDVVDNPGLNLVLKASPNPQAESRRVSSRQPNVFVQVKRFHRAPRDFGKCHQFLHHGDLGVTRRDHNARVSFPRHRLPDYLGSLQGRRQCEGFFFLKDMNSHVCIY